MQLYYFEACPFCQKVLNIIDELNIRDHIEFRDTLQDEKHRAELIQLTGRTQVPCLVIDGSPMLESDDIVAYLKDKYSK